MFKRREKPTPPEHLRPATAAWWEAVAAEFDLAEHHLKLLTLAAEAWDRCQQARESLAENGLVFADRFGKPHARPEISVERDSRIGFARLIRELNLDVDPPEEIRPPVLTRKRA